MWAAYALAMFLIIDGVWLYLTYAADKPRWPVVILFVALLFPLKMHVTRRLVTLRLHDDHLTVESGFFSRTRRTVGLAKIQDVTVRQTLGQRILGVGDLMLESAGESGGMAVLNLDNPRQLADTIIAGSKRPGSR